LAEIRKALDHGELTSEGLLPVEGPKLIQEAMDSGLAVEAVFVRRDVSSLDVPIGSRDVYALDAAAFKKIQSTETSQGVIALVRLKKFAMLDLILNPKGPLVVLDRLQDPGNVGTVFRIAESFGAAGCIGLSDTARPYNPKAVRASAGSVLRLPHVWNVTAESVAVSLRDAHIPLVGTSPRAASTLTEWDWRRPTAVLIGNEGRGLSSEETLLCETVLRIPHRPRVESLNSAIAAGIILYEAFKQRGFE